MEKIVFLPLDERPCNYYYPKMLMVNDYELIIPPFGLMGKKKVPADSIKIEEWLIKNTLDASILVVSLDTLIYGGIVPSRLNNDPIETLLKRSDILKTIKKNNPKIKILAFELVMRCPSYSSGDEEPDYYEEVGYEIHMIGEYNHKEMLGILEDDEKKLREKYLKKVKKEYLSDYLNRRERNLKVLTSNLNLLRENIIDFLIIPQDDTSVYGYTTMDKEKVFSYIKSNGLENRTAIYPSADDTGLTLLSRALTIIKNKCPKIYVDYAAVGGEKTIPCFEDQMVDKTINYQITSAGCIRTYDKNDSDIVLFVNIGSFMSDIKNKNIYYKEYFVDRDLDAFIKRIKEVTESEKIAAIADVAYPNGSDIDLIEKMSSEGLLYRVGSYAGWNTSSNTLGTTISFAVHYYFDNDEKCKNEFLTLRYLEDYGYMAFVRSDVTENDLPGMGLNYFDLSNKNKEVSEIIKKKILDKVKTEIKEVYDRVGEIKVSQPWNRMFETFIEVKIK